jgi:transcriptional regulator with XRE-family HTH domain
MKGGLDVRIISHEALASYMSYRGLSVRELAMKTGIHRATIGHLRSGGRHTCTPESARAIAKALDVPVDILFRVQSPLRVARNAA